jgi:NitT/TauT family transport system ATP-binding protein
MDPAAMIAAPLPPVGITEILGLLKVLDDRGDRADISRLSHELQIDTAELVPALQGAEMLGLVQTPGGDVVLLPLGKQVTHADMNTKKAILKEQMEKLPLFRYFMDFLSRQPEKAVEKPVVLEELSILVPSEDPERLYSTILKWGRYGEIFGFSHDSGRFFLNTRGRRRRMPPANALTTGGVAAPADDASTSGPAAGRDQAAD